ncbi:DUF6912 family protein [Cellulomonas shaoxiangyii]|uniref:Uncharacterized protein n=1 Tax=Cellulomonas shaoxiangyii TaxID=2566013 RepID=A0A4P7SJA6_9CELL|nr:hypothetical protein [Cellulomonas shaoxiangyii]QCB93176.1 hypothetical protein E5225_06020 [Cellulomonas shaoxiangyii]TGY81182.1 hypothetical protein E5226_14565 [Cellulomonas shaoxiangyii]
MRVYIPVTLDELQESSPVLLDPRPAHAVTAALRAAWSEEDEEGWEYAAQASAADGSLVLLAGRPDAPRLRVLVAADVADACVTAPATTTVPSAVDVVCGVGLDQIVSIHVDEPEAAEDVAAAAAGDEDALERLEERDLLWYDVTEVADIPRA